MKDFGFIRAAAAVPRTRVADIDSNVREICRLIDDACEEYASLVVFPELCVTGYSCADLFGNELLAGRAEAGIADIARHCSGRNVTVAVGAPVRHNSRLYNCAVIISGSGGVCGIVPK